MAAASRDDLEKIAEQVRTCTKCPLHEGRKLTVPGDGPAYAEIMIVGEGPGVQEDLSGHPFVGSAGKLLTRLLESIGLERSDVFITNIVKCRPPDNRPPRKGEASECIGSYLERQIRVINPRILVPLGTPAINWIMGEEYSATKVHGQVFRRDQRLIVPLYHPAAALYDARLESTLFEDVKVLRKLLSEEPEKVEATLIS